MGFAVGRLYVEQHFGPEAKARMDELIANLVEAYRRNISDLDWMTPATRRGARKLRQVHPQIGYPAHWRDYSALVVDRGDLVATTRGRCRSSRIASSPRSAHPSTATNGSMTPQTVNAY